MEQLVGTLLNNFVIPLLTAIVVALLGVVLQFVYKKLKISVNADLQKAILEEAEKLVLSVEEKGAAKLTEASKNWTGADKLAEVVNGLVSKFPKLSQKDAEDIALKVVAAIPGIGVTQIPQGDSTTKCSQ